MRCCALQFFVDISVIEFAVKGYNGDCDKLMDCCRDGVSL